MLEHHPGTALSANPASPTSSIKTNIASGIATADSRSHAYLNLGTPEGRLPRSGSQAEFGNSHFDGHGGGTLPPSGSSLNLLTEGLRETHLDGHEPRYIPGMMARASRHGSMHRGSMHESDDTSAGRNAHKKANGKEESS